MVVEFTGRQVEIAPAVRALAERKIDKLARVLPGITHVRVVLAADKHRQRAEVSVHSPHLDLVANEVAADAAVAVSTVIDKLTRQAQRHKEKVRGGKRRASVRGTRVRPAAPAPAEGGARVIRSRRFVAKPMTLEEAALVVGTNGDGVLVFRNAATRRIGVLFRRRDGNLGLIEPEA
jgi:putative sigma-54 modulation protein